MKTITRFELQEIIGIKDPGTLADWETKYRCLPKRAGEENHSPFFNLFEVIKLLESKAFPFKVRPTALDDLRELAK